MRFKFLKELPCIESYDGRYMYPLREVCLELHKDYYTVLLKVPKEHKGYVLYCGKKVRAVTPEYVVEMFLLHREGVARYCAERLLSPLLPDFTVEAFVHAQNPCDRELARNLLNMARERKPHKEKREIFMGDLLTEMMRGGLVTETDMGKVPIYIEALRLYGWCFEVKDNHYLIYNIGGNYHE